MHIYLLIKPSLCVDRFAWKLEDRMLQLLLSKKMNVIREAIFLKRFRNFEELRAVLCAPD